MGLYVVAPTSPASRPSAVYGAIAVLVTYVIMRRIVSRIAMEYLPR